VLSAPPLNRNSVRYVAIVPNLVQIQRQLAALEALQQASPEGPLAPLRAALSWPACGSDAGRDADVGA
jgi:hypothetical protein